MPKNNCYIVIHDPFIFQIYTKDEAKEEFGYNVEEDGGTFIPQELLDRYKKANEEYWAVQHEIEKYKKLP